MEQQIEKPTLDQVKEWTKKDLLAAAYFLNLLQRYPEIIDQMAKTIYDHAMLKENGPAIDHVEPQKSRKYAG